MPHLLLCMSVISACPRFQDHQIATDNKLRMIGPCYSRVNRFRRKAVPPHFRRRTPFEASLHNKPPPGTLAALFVIRPNEEDVTILY